VGSCVKSCSRIAVAPAISRLGEAPGSAVESCKSRRVKSVHILILCTSILNDSRRSMPSAAATLPASHGHTPLECLSVPHAGLVLSV
jgi:hypothetical protein